MRTFTTISTSLISLSVFATVATAGDPPKAGAPAPKDAKAAPAMPEMKPPAELAAMAKTMEGTWTCKGKALGQDMKTMTDMTATMKASLEMGGYWMHDSFDAKMGGQPFHFESFTTYDAASKKWKRVMAEMGGGWSTGEAAATPGKMDFELTSHGPMGEAPFKDHVDATNPKAIKAWGEMSMDKGKSFTKIYEMTCSK